MQFLDMKAPYLELESELDDAYQGFMDSGWYVLEKRSVPGNGENDRYIFKFTNRTAYEQ